MEDGWCFVRVGVDPSVKMGSPIMSKRFNKNNRKGKGNSSRGKRTSATLLKTSGGFPDSVRVKLNYIATYTGSTGASVVVAQVMRGNGPYDPDASGTGAQPYNYDDWTQQYQRYRVWGSRITVTPFGTGNTYITQGAQLVIIPSQDGTSITSGEFDSTSVAPYAKYFNYNGTIIGSMYPRGFSHSMTTQKIYGLTRAQMLGSDALSSAYNSTPSQQWYWQVTFASFDNAATVPVWFRVKVEYDVEFYQRVPQTIDSLVSRRDLLDRKIKAISDVKMRPNIASVSGRERKQPTIVLVEEDDLSDPLNKTVTDVPVRLQDLPSVRSLPLKTGGLPRQ